MTPDDLQRAIIALDPFQCSPSVELSESGDNAAFLAHEAMRDSLRGDS